MQHSVNQTKSGDHNDYVTPDILTTQEAAQHLGLAVSTLNKWRVYGSGPKFIKLGRAVRYRLKDLETFMTTRTKLSTSQPNRVNVE